MRVIFGLKKIRKFKRPVVALGIFDGVHLGHRYILKGTVSKANEIKGTGIVLTFWPHPQRKESLYSLEHRLRLIAEFGIDACIVIKFTLAFSKISAEDFVKDILIDKIGAKYIYIGKNFRFGKGAQGDSRLLNKLSCLYNFNLKVSNVIRRNGQTVSSTYIRRLIKRGDINQAKNLLTRPVSILGTVISGDTLGRVLGFPTANIDPHHEVLPPSGIYAVKTVFNKKRYNGVCYIGIKPTFMAKRKSEAFKSIEVYIFNFNKNIYGKYLEIQFIKKLRNERKFVSSQELIKQIKKDITNVKSYFPTTKTYH